MTTGCCSHFPEVLMDHSDTTPLRSSTGHESTPMESSDCCEPALPGKAMDSDTNPAHEDAQFWKHMAAKDGQLMNSAVLAKQSVLVERPMCRICHDGGGQEELLSPCECAGTLGTIHRSCLEHWLSASSTSFCELCHFQFSVQRKARPLLEVCSLLQRLCSLVVDTSSHLAVATKKLEWIRNPGLRQEKRTLFGDMVCFLLITPLATISGWLCLRGAVDHLHFSSRLEAVGLIALTVALFTIYLFWTLVSLRYHCRLYNEWRQTNQRVVLLLPKSHSDSLGNPSVTGLLSVKRPSKESIV
ncbi:E3 ubiquitin-protein ligase MARCHF3-like isoform X1 [Tachysurus vachellii]|uniref:E3 ubiquitin-protein ligase MARCHF3-like isoform X1 n=1 Tax=Tachysurus vachellii TaxID=175792 RepID=UPI00296ADDF1|nr:E3 ubiquitin-protein ligase MARCHF3-like isoform X1 [Tachysurus vachellii]XP_060752257.1 E3 ubiquitin-protein ligase MARCHF3-like isoform X1 [Tachysurus vachellii]XP_060752259.1 E3 ubiquitin-protein ligase MARCHF3-like isoform X1 [Tachysurus vachellii]